MTFSIDIPLLENNLIIPRTHILITLLKILIYKNIDVFYRHPLLENNLIIPRTHILITLLKILIYKNIDVFYRHPLLENSLIIPRSVISTTHSEMLIYRNIDTLPIDVPLLENNSTRSQVTFNPANWWWRPPSSPSQ